MSVFDNFGIKLYDEDNNELLSSSDYIIISLMKYMNDNIKFDHNNLLYEYVMSLVVIPTNSIKVFSLEEFRENAFSYDNFVFDIENGEFVCKLSGKVPIECANFNVNSLEELCDICRSMYVDQLLE